MPTYDEPRPSIPAEVRRAVEVEAGHACSVVRCPEHTYLEIHHINENRADNRVENLILLCDKHHKMAHAGVIDRKALAEYKRLLKESYGAGLLDRIRRLEELMDQGTKLEAEPAAPATHRQSDPDLPGKTVVPRSDLTHLTLEQLAIAKYERDHNLILERQATFMRGSSALQLDAVRQDDDLDADLLIEVRWLRKRYLDAPVWVKQVDAATSAYELMTGRKGRGILIFVVPKEDMKSVENLPLTLQALQTLERKPEVVCYSYADLHFNPGAISADLFGSNIRTS